MREKWQEMANTLYNRVFSFIQFLLTMVQLHINYTTTSIITSTLRMESI